MMSWIQTFTGRKFFPLAPRPDDICIQDIAHALSMKCRFGGHCQTFYTVAEHSVRVSRRLESGGSQLALWGLMHDAGEAYLPDVGAPIKNTVHLHLDGQVLPFGDAEDRILEAVAAALNFPPIDYAAVRTADLELLVTEARDLLSTPPEPWNLGVSPLPDRILPAPTPAAAEALFLSRYHELRTR